jgi:hypothetical protein
MKTRARKQGILINVDWDHIQNKPVSEVTFESLQTNGDVGSGADQVAQGNHDHDVGDLSLWFQNKLI